MIKRYKNIKYKRYKNLSMSHDKKVMTLLPSIEKCTMDFYRGVVFTAQI